MFQLSKHLQLRMKKVQKVIYDKMFLISYFLTMLQATESPIEKYPQEIPRGGEDEISNRTDQRLTTHANGQTTNVTCFCGKLCKNHQGLKIHQARMKCLERESEALPRASPAPVEDFEGDLAKRKSCWPVEVCWGSVDSQRGELEKHQPVSNHLTTECRREGVF